ncbi:MAG: hypothetical protein M9894_11460 [Planctomycetes bacterium]|nr:hypothetical protein [Planctomycetota bacterium]
MTRPLIAALLAVAFALPARAQEGPPVLTEVRLDRRRVTAVSPDHLIEVRGSGLHACPPLPEPAPGGPPPRSTCRHEEVEVTLGGVQQRGVLSHDAERLVLIVPEDTPLGRHPLVVTIRGRGTATLDLEVVEHVPLLYRPGQGCVTTETWQPPRELHISRFQLVTGTDGLRRFVVEGGAPGLPDGCSVEALLLYGGEDGPPLASRRLPVEEGRFRTEFEAPFRPLPLGTYHIEVVFELAQEPRDGASELTRTLPPAAVKRLERVDLGALLQLGTHGEVLAEVRRIQEHVHALARDLARLAADLGDQEAAADRLAFEAWARTTFLPCVAAALGRADAFDRGFAFPPAPRARERLTRLCALLAGWYAELAAALEVDASLRAVPGVTPAPSRSPREALEAERRRLLILVDSAAR